jgi:hypothetical protein
MGNKMRYETPLPARGVPPCFDNERGKATAAGINPRSREVAYNFHFSHSRGDFLYTDRSDQCGKLKIIFLLTFNIVPAYAFGGEKH